MDVRLPDGTIIKNVPDGTTQEDLEARFVNYKRYKAEGRDDAVSKLPPSRNLLSSVAHGAIDTASGAAQLVSRGATALGLPPGSDYPFLASPDVVDRSTAEARAKVDKQLGPTNSGGIDLVRGASSGVLATPFMGPVGTAQTMVGRTGQAFRAGGIQGGLQPVTEAKDGFDFMGKKAIQVGTGAAVSAVAQPALEFGAQGLGNLSKLVTDRAAGAIKDTSQDAAVAFAVSTLAARGIKWAELKDDVKRSIVADVQEAMKKYGGVNAASLGRQADFKELGIDPLGPWVTRDPVKWGQYKNLETAKDAGEPLILAKAAAEEKLRQRLGSGGMGDAYQSGRVAEDALSKAHAGAKAKIDAHYDAFRRLAPTAQADGKRMAEELFVELDQSMAQKFLPPELRETLNDMVLGKIPATPTVLHQLQKIASTEARRGGNAGYASGKVVGAIDREMDRFADEMSVVGPEMADAVKALRQGRSEHRALKMKEESIPALKAVADGSFAAEDFFNRYIKGADVKEVAAMWVGVQSPEMKSAARSQIIDYLKGAASGKGAEAAPFRPDRFAEAINAPGMPQKIKIILGEKGLDEVQRISRAAEAMTRTPPGARYNTSGTAMEMANILSRTSGLPVLGPMVTKPLSEMMSQLQASGMTKPGAGAIGQGLLDPFYEELLRRSRQGVGLLSPLAGGSASGEFTR